MKRQISHRTTGRARARAEKLTTLRRMNSGSVGEVTMSAPLPLMILAACGRWRSGMIRKLRIGS